MIFPQNHRGKGLCLPTHALRTFTIVLPLGNANPLTRAAGIWQKLWNLRVQSTMGPTECSILERLPRRLHGMAGMLNTSPRPDRRPPSLALTTLALTAIAMVVAVVAFTALNRQSEGRLWGRAWNVQAVESVSKNTHQEPAVAQRTHVTPTGWRRTSSGWQRSEQWTDAKPIAKPIDHWLREGQRRESRWVEQASDVIRRYPPVGFAGLLVFVASILALMPQPERRR